LASSAGDVKPDKKASQEAYQRGVRADAVNHLAEAIGAYTDAIQADDTNAAAYRARAKDYLATGDPGKALGDLEQAIRLQPGNGPSYGICFSSFPAAQS